MSRKIEILELLKWNTWANQRYRKVMGNYSLDDLSIETVYGSLLERIVHIFASFEMWYKRMKGDSPQNILSASDFNTWDELEEAWIASENLLFDFVNNLNEEDLIKEVTYTSFDGTVYTRQIRHILLHLTAHPNYHRGQISAIFKKKGLSKLPSTDLVIYFLDKPNN